MDALPPLPRIIVARNGMLTAPGLSDNGPIRRMVGTTVGVTAASLYRTYPPIRSEFRTRFDPIKEEIAGGEPHLDFNNRGFDPVKISKVLLFFNLIYFSKEFGANYDAPGMLDKPIPSETGGTFSPIREIKYVERISWAFLLRLKRLFDKLEIPATILNLPSDLPYGKVEDLQEIRKQLNSEPVLTPMMREYMGEYGLEPNYFRFLPLQDQKVQEISNLLQKQKGKGGGLSPEELQKLERLIGAIDGSTMLFGAENIFKGKAKRWLDTLISKGLESLVEEVYPGGAEAWKEKNRRKNYDYAVSERKDGTASIKFYITKGGARQLALEIPVGAIGNQMNNPFCPLIMCGVLRRAEQLGFSHWIGALGSREAKIVSAGVLLSKHIFGTGIKHYVVEFDPRSGLPLSWSHGQLALRELAYWKTRIALEHQTAMFE